MAWARCSSGLARQCSLQAEALPLPASWTAHCYTGHRLDRGVLCYGEGNQYVYGEWLGISSRDLSGDLH